MRVALTMRITDGVGYHEPRDSLAQDWIRTLESWGMIPLSVPNGLADPAQYVTALCPDLIVLTGGDDPHEVNLRRQTENALLTLALNDGLPLLGVCRGMQVTNLLLGGTTTSVVGHVATPHRVSMTSEDWQTIYGECIEVNSFHNIGIEKAGLAARLLCDAVDDDGHVEAFHHIEKPIAGVMWHPERLGAPVMDQDLFRNLISMRRDV